VPDSGRRSLGFRRHDAQVDDLHAHHVRAGRQVAELEASEVAHTLALVIRCLGGEAGARQALHQSAPPTRRRGPERSSGCVRRRVRWRLARRRNYGSTCSARVVR
jgi:hypothetical protein